MKKSYRLLRDASLVVVFCVGFLGLIGLANFLQNDTGAETSSEFSKYRMGADKAAAGHNLNVSLQNLRALVKNDPYDGRAQYELASTLFSRVVEAQDAIAESNRNTLQSSTDQQQQTEQRNQQTSLRDQPSPALSLADTSKSTRDREADLNILLDQAIQEYKLAEKHARYRSRSRIQLAALQAAKGDFEAAMDSLEHLVNDGGFTRRGLDQIGQFGSSLYLNKAPTKLHTQPRFWNIVAMERANRGRPIRYFPTLSQRDTNIWNFLKRLNRDLIPYRIELVYFVRKLFK